VSTKTAKKDWRRLFRTASLLFLRMADELFIILCRWFTIVKCGSAKSI